MGWERKRKGGKKERREKEEKEEKEEEEEKDEMRARPWKTASAKPAKTQPSTP